MTLCGDLPGEPPYASQGRPRSERGTMKNKLCYGDTLEVLRRYIQDEKEL